MVLLRRVRIIEVWVGRVAADRGGFELALEHDRGLAVLASRAAIGVVSVARSVFIGLAAADLAGG